MGIKLLLMIILICNIENNPYSIILVDDNMGSANYIRPIVNNNGDLFILTGETENSGNKYYKRRLIKYYYSGKHERINYSSKYNFSNGEIALVDNNILFVTTPSSFEMLNDKGNCKEYSYEKYGYRRTLKRAESNYYIYAHSDEDNHDCLIIDKFELKYNSGPILPTPSIIKTSSSIPVLIYQAMYSCDLTKDNSYILCVYFSPDKDVKLSFFNTNLALVRTETYENVPDSYPDYFIKILHFKENSKFILMNSRTDTRIRLRYFNFINNKIISQLYSILCNGNDYLDVDETQFSPQQYSNEIIAVDNKKIIKIYAGDDNIIITIFNFLENDSILYIKIFKMNNFKENGFNWFTQPRLAVFKDTLVVCISTNYNNQPKQSTGYFFLNYPNSKDINISGNTNKIKIKDLISIENNLFSLILKLRPIQIPQDFILRNSNSQNIKEGVLLDINDEIKIIQYRKNTRSNIFKFEGVANGNMAGFSHSKIYPSYKVPYESNFYIKGREGKIQFDYNGDDCLNGYYHLDYDLDLCTTIKPPKYYIDENSKTYKACQSPCDECNGPIISDELMNCITCKNDFYITEDTNSCYKEKENYYLDNNILKRCHPRCSKCITGSKDNKKMNCLACIYNYEDIYYYKDDSLNCITASEFKKRDLIDLSSVPNDVFSRFIAILIISIVLGFITILSRICKKERPPETNDDKKKNIELGKYKKLNDKEDKEDKEDPKSIND